MSTITTEITTEIITFVMEFIGTSVKIEIPFDLIVLICSYFNVCPYNEHKWSFNSKKKICSLENVICVVCGDILCITHGNKCDNFYCNKYVCKYCLQNDYYTNYSRFSKCNYNHCKSTCCRKHLIKCQVCRLVHCKNDSVEYDVEEGKIKLCLFCNETFKKIQNALEMK